ncbi:uncharacterized protein E0L32_009909 [Thyridium curvatum]|uniref:Zn(2)-C6 fungal-type domain-containing protein n=1 Tax=Thyridium curvatum TaxID=1093900 RepID=A0A507AWC8_9PEZI|nr:uncharacterized protein E0L32_009909 [Thyridium curvatum]TPX08570.1 hypothetical protein E0L32_009909 [Thyridium curvatum]
MLKRISHRKSRKGCSSCKRRHVKGPVPLSCMQCDETGPPCSNCKIRGLDCNYNVIIDGTRSIRPRPANSSSPDNVPSGAGAPAGDAEERRLLELELIHRWSTHTYKSMCSLKEDEEYVQNILPRKGYQHAFVMDTIIAFTALEVATTTAPAANSNTSSPVGTTPTTTTATPGSSSSSPSTGSVGAVGTTSQQQSPPTSSAPSSKYLRIALEYNDRASAGFRANLSNITKDNISLLYICSGLVLVINIAIPQCLELHGFERQSTLANAARMFDLLNGMLVIAFADFDTLMSSDYAPSLQAALALGTADPREHLAQETIDALALLHPVNDRNSELLGEQAQRDNDERPPAERNPTHEEYKEMVKFIVICFAEDRRDAIKGYCLGFPAFCGPPFPRAIKEREPMALFFLLYWAVLLHNLGAMAWWARSVGRRMAEEISDILRRSGLYMASPEGRQAVAWVRRQVDLPDLPDSPGVEG